MKHPHVALVHDNFTGPTGMGLVTERHAEWVLAAGWPLTIVGDNVPSWLIERARVIAALKPGGLPSFAEHVVWCARARRGLRLVRADVVHVHSPLLASHADLLTTHFIERPAHARRVREATEGLEGRMRGAQAALSRRLDDRLYRRLARTTAVSFVSEFLRDEFAAVYGEPRGGWILSPPAPPWRPVGDDERVAARAKFGVEGTAVVAGYVGGNDPRKGYAHLTALEARDDIAVLLAGPGSERMRSRGRTGLGFVDVDELYAACDVVVAPAVFDSAPVAVLQAVARGVPVVLSDASGWARAVARHGAGAVWNEGEPLADVLLSAARRGRAGCEELTDEFSARNQRDRLLDVYSRIAGSA